MSYFLCNISWPNLVMFMYCKFCNISWIAIFQCKFENKKKLAISAKIVLLLKLALLKICHHQNFKEYCSKQKGLTWPIFSYRQVLLHFENDSFRIQTMGNTADRSKSDQKNVTKFGHLCSLKLSFNQALAVDLCLTISLISVFEMRRVAQSCDIWWLWPFKALWPASLVFNSHRPHNY